MKDKVSANLLSGRVWDVQESGVEGPSKESNGGQMEGTDCRSLPNP